MLARVLEILPLEQSLANLNPSHPRTDAAADRIRTLVNERTSPIEKAAFLVYIDDIHAAHVFAQNDESESGALWHGIIHRLEGDFSNARYWFRRASNRIHELGIDPIALNRDVESGEIAVASLVARQRDEWLTIVTQEWAK